MPFSSSADHPDPDRRHWMSVLARADAASIADRLAAWGQPPDFTRLRGPESGLVMVRGRTGGNGAPFNLGEMTVTRCSVRTQAGLIGHAYVAGRDTGQAELAALVDAMMQDPGQRDSLRQAVIAPLEAIQAERREALAAKAAATKVQFFAMQTMRS
ncbi:MAG: phosphonate C-P lyase system protein PhnG [Acetobacteraceae bacterium]